MRAVRCHGDLRADDEQADDEGGMLPDPGGTIGTAEDSDGSAFGQKCFEKEPEEVNVRRE
jgi:hypothetical protein